MAAAREFWNSPLRLLAAACCALLAQAAAAQCARSWTPFVAPSGVQGPVHAIRVWDPDGAGPQPVVVVAGGSFAQAGDVALQNLGAYDFASRSWSPLGAGVNGTVRAFAVLQNGDLVAGGSFTTAGGLPAAGVARWSGGAWQPLGLGVNGSVYALLLLGNGDLVAAGDFTQAGGQPALHIARWDGAAWTPFGGGLAGGTALALAVLPNGDLVAGGGFSAVTATGVGERIARWDGTAWQSLGSGVDNDVRSLLVLANGELVVSGAFAMAGGLLANGIARWDGAAWLLFANGAGFGNGGRALAVLNSGILIAGGNNGIGSWNGSFWQSFAAADGPSSSSPVMALTKLPSGALLAGGEFRTINGDAVDNIAVWDGAWHPLGRDFDKQIRCIVPLGGPQFVCAGEFTDVGGAPHARIARWDGAAWSSYGSGMNATIHAVVRLPNGDLVAGGEFTTAGGVACNRIARWNGSAWQPLGSGLNGTVTAMLALPNGDVVAGGAFTLAGGAPCNRIARWNGTAWSPLGVGRARLVSALALLPNGDIVAGSVSSGTAADVIARWDGTAWIPLVPHSFQSAESIAILPGGALVASGYGQSSSSDRIARWTASGWVTFGDVVGFVRSLAVAPNGDLLAAGAFATISSMPAGWSARWDGVSWQPLASVPHVELIAQAWLPDGQVLLASKFPATGSTPSASLLRVPAGCPAAASPIPTACQGPTGPLVAAAVDWPWIGGTCTTRALGFAPGALVAVATGFTSPGTPLAALHPAGLPGCSLLASTEALQFAVPVAGAASYAFVLPKSMSLVGLQLRQQYVQAALDGQGTLTSLSSSNGLALVVGAF